MVVRNYTFSTRIFPLKTLDYPHFERFPSSRANLTYRLHFGKKCSGILMVNGKQPSHESDALFSLQTMELTYARYVSL